MVKAENLRNSWKEKLVKLEKIVFALWDSYYATTI